MIIIMIFLVLGLVSSASIDMLGDLTVSGSLDCEGLIAETLYSEGTVHTTETLTTSDITSDSVTVTELTVTSLYPKDTEIVIDADVIIKPPPTTSSFVEVQWELFTHEDFQKDLAGWNGAREDCSNEDYFVKASFGEEIEKVYELPKHSRVRVSASVHFIDDWNGESVFLKVNEKIVWAQNAVSGKISVCGDSKPDAGYSVPVDVVVNDSGELLKVSFGSSLTRDLGSFGVDDVMIYLK